MSKIGFSCETEPPGGHSCASDRPLSVFFRFDGQLNQATEGQIGRFLEGPQEEKPSERGQEEIKQ